MTTTEIKSSFSSTSLPATVSPKRVYNKEVRPGTPILLHHDIPDYLHRSLLPNVQSKTPALSSKSTLYRDDSTIAQTLFGSSDDVDKQKIFKFCSTLHSNLQKMAVQQHDSLNINAINNYRNQIGKLIFLGDKDSKKTAALLDFQDIPSSLLRLQNATDDEIDKIVDGLNAQCKSHDAVPLQDSSFVMSTRKPLAIASILLTSAGLINVNFMKMIKEYFYTNTPLLRCEMELLQTLDVINKSPEILQQLQNVTKPASPNFISNAIIRITLNLKEDDVITDNHARLVVLAALLSDIRQGDVGSCFATCVSILMMGTLRSKVISDFADIIKNGKLSRPSATDQTDFVPTIDIADNNVQIQQYIDKSGKLEYIDGDIWQSPGIIAACKQIGIVGKDVETEIKNAIAYIFQKKYLSDNVTVGVSVDELVELLIVRTQGKLNPQKFKDVKTLAEVAFSAETNTPLLRAWESCLAAMSEAKSGDYKRQRILECVVSQLKQAWPSSYSYGVSDTASHVQDVFLRILNASIQLRYDEREAIGIPNSSGDGHSKITGAFVLHALEKGENIITARRITCPDEFNSFVIDNLKKTNEMLTLVNSGDHEACLGYQTTINKIVNYVSQAVTGFTSFIYNAIRFYHEDNKTLFNTLSNWEEFAHLPFRDADGGDNAPVFTKATGFSLAQTSVRPKNAMDLLRAFIEFGRERAKIDGFLTDDDPYQRYMADTPTHAFTLTPEDPTVVGAMKGNETAREWINIHIVLPGMGVANQQLTESQKTCFINGIKQDVLPKELHSRFLIELKMINPSINSVRDYSKMLVDIVLRIMPKNPDITPSQITSDITTVLIEKVLSARSKKILIDSAVHIADTNWVHQGVRHVYFACFFDPIANAVSLCTIDEDGNNLRPIDQDKWVTNVPWELYGVKLTPTLDNHKVERLTIDERVATH